MSHEPQLPDLGGHPYNELPPLKGRREIPQRVRGMKRQETASFTPAQESVALLIASGAKIRSAAAKAQVGERTVHTWLDDPNFVALIARHRSRFIERGLGMLARHVSKSVTALAKCLDSESDSAKVRAAEALLNQLLRFREHIDIEPRLAELEERINREHPRPD
jgi:hypothetical protein